MRMKDLARKVIREYNPVAFSTLRRMRKEIRNKNVSFLCPDCLGGILFHDLGLQFRSPTVNLMLTQPDFVKFVLDLDHYLSLELEFFKDEVYTFPCAKLGDITLYFTHYHSEQHAAEKWHERAKRLDRDNLFVLLLERDGLTEAQIRSLADLPVRGLVVFTANDYPDIPYALHVPRLVVNGEVEKTLQLSPLTGLRGYEASFDFVKWFNESDGKNGFDITPYKKFFL